MSLLPFFTWCDGSALGNAIRSSTYIFPILEVFHLLGLAIIGGAVLLIDMRLFGIGLRRQPVAEIARYAQPFLVASLLVMMVSGGLLFTSEAIKCYRHEAFWFKMVSLFLAIVFTFTVQRRVTMADETRVGPITAKVVAMVSLTLWACVGIGGRWIGFT
jgi:hypothetical protein